MNIHFEAINLKKKDTYYSYWNKTPLRSLDYTLANLWGWQEYYGLEWCFHNDICLIRQTKPNIFYWAPLGNWQQTDWQQYSPLLKGQTFIRVPELLTEIWQQFFPENKQEEERGQWEYLYSQEELANLPGNRFHKKKNHLNSYIKTYGAQNTAQSLMR